MNKLEKLIAKAQKKINIMKKKKNPHAETEQSAHYWLDLALREGVEQAIIEWGSSL